MMTLCKFYISFLENNCVDLVEDLVDFHSSMVDPRELCVSIAWFSLLDTEEALKKCPHVRLYLILTQYTKEKTREQAGGLLPLCSSRTPR